MIGQVPKVRSEGSLREGLSKGALRAFGGSLRDHIALTTSIRRSSSSHYLPYPRPADSEMPRQIGMIPACTIVNQLLIL